jgi:hypothetical protein
MNFLPMLMLVKKLEKKLNCILIASREAHKNGKKSIPAEEVYKRLGLNV